jgi:phospholipase C
VVGQFQDAIPGSPLSNMGILGQTLGEFHAQALNGTLPAVSYIIGTIELSEYQSFAPREGAWLQRQSVDTVVKGKGYAKTASSISYDEEGGCG